VWRHIAQSVPGIHHLGDGKPCQDHCQARVLGNGGRAALVACVADGAGYSQHSDVGAKLACQSIVESAAAYFESAGSFARLSHSDVLEWCEVARNKISDYALAQENNLREYATTLCAATISAAGSAFFQIGDGAMIVRRRAALGVVFWPQSGEYVNTTNFLTATDFRGHLQFIATKGGFADVALLTDGIERLALRFDSFTPHPPFFEPLFRAVRGSGDAEGLGAELRQFLESDSVRNKNDDDKTLVLASHIGDQS
jgi:hypothetical protein